MNAASDSDHSALPDNGHPEQIVICSAHGDWIEWDKPDVPEGGDCPHPTCRCTPTLYDQRRVVEAQAKALGHVTIDQHARVIEAMADAYNDAGRLRVESEALKEALANFAVHDEACRFEFPDAWDTETCRVCELLAPVASDEKCPNCHGTGEDPVPRQIGRPCPRCDGSGESRDSHPTPEEGR